MSFAVQKPDYRKRSHYQAVAMVLLAFEEWAVAVALEEALTVVLEDLPVVAEIVAAAELESERQIEQ